MTLSPSSRLRRAAHMPERPAPTTMTSAASVAVNSVGSSGFLRQSNMPSSGVSQRGLPNSFGSKVRPGFAVDLTTSA